jgi:hypothetical protein
MKLLKNKVLLALLVLISGYGYIISCTHDNTTPPPAAVTRIKNTAGTGVFKPGKMTAGNANEWKLDKVHSNCMWSSNYMGAAGLLTGRFNQFGMHNVLPSEMTLYPANGQPVKDTSWAFYEGDDSKSYFNGYVQINTSNTGEPGRDTGCNISGMGTQRISYYGGQYCLRDSNIAQLKTTKVTFDPTTGDYIVNFNLTWKGKLTSPLTEPIVGRLSYVKRATIAGTAPYDVFGLKLVFQLNCRDYGVTCTSVGDKINIECNMNFNNK